MSSKHNPLFVILNMTSTTPIPTFEGNGYILIPCFQILHLYVITIVLRYFIMVNFSQVFSMKTKGGAADKLDCFVSLHGILEILLTDGAKEEYYGN